MKVRVLFVDDNAELLDIARILFQQTDPNLELVVALSVKDALGIMEKEEFDIIISDYLMPDATGLDFLEALRCAGDEIGFIMWTGHSREEVVIKALNLGADYYVLKGTDIREQFKAIHDIIGKVIDAKYQLKEQIAPKGIPSNVASEFIHRLSHDLTGILQNIMGYTTLLEEDFNKSYIQGIVRMVAKLSDRVKEAVMEIDEERLILK
ncbi:MAG: response regulator [Candidatus Thorarchaeota archaeon]|nr:response regulator [Candidatus Thorarchaeota archaeon]